MVPDVFFVAIPLDPDRYTPDKRAAFATGFAIDKGWTFLTGSRANIDAIRFKLGVDGFSFPFIVLTAFLMPFCIGASWSSVEKRVPEYMVAFLVLETLMIGVFGALDLVLFYLFFEAGLIPMFLIIGIWGGKRRVYASYKFFLYTLLGSVLMLLAILLLWYKARTNSIPELNAFDIPFAIQVLLFLALRLYPTSPVRRTYACRCS